MGELVLLRLLKNLMTALYYILRESENKLAVPLP